MSFFIVAPKRSACGLTIRRKTEAQEKERTQPFLLSFIMEKKEIQVLKEALTHKLEHDKVIDELEHVSRNAPGSFSFIKEGEKAYDQALCLQASL